jgi:hypothetical protein
MGLWRRERFPKPIWSIPPGLGLHGAWAEVGCGHQTDDRPRARSLSGLSPIRSTRRRPHTVGSGPKQEGGWCSSICGRFSWNYSSRTTIRAPGGNRSTKTARARIAKRRWSAEQPRWESLLAFIRETRGRYSPDTSLRFAPRHGTRADMIDVFHNHYVTTE